MALDRGTREQEIDLVVVVAVATQVLDDADTGLAVSDGGVQVVLLAVLVDAKSFCRWGEDVLLEGVSSGRTKRERSDMRQRGKMGM